MKSRKEIEELLVLVTSQEKNDMVRALLLNPSVILLFRMSLGVSQEKFSKIVGISVGHLRDLEQNRKKTTLKTAVKIRSSLRNIRLSDLNLDRIYQNYTDFMNLTVLTGERAREIRKLRNVYPNKEMPNKWKDAIGREPLARIVGTINGDGHLQLETGKGLVSFYSKNMYEIGDIKKLFMSLFDLKGITYENYKNSERHRLYYTGRPIALFLLEAGVVRGNKTNMEYLTPEWILNGNKEVRSSYLRGLYNTEGSVVNSRGRWQITLNQSKNEKLRENGLRYFNQIRTLLKRFGMHPSPVIVCMGKRKPRKDGSKTLIFKIDLELKDFKKFYTHVGFDNRKKLKRLNKALNT